MVLVCELLDFIFIFLFFWNVLFIIWTSLSELCNFRGKQLKFNKIKHSHSFQNVFNLCGLTLCSQIEAKFIHMDKNSHICLLMYKNTSVFSARINCPKNKSLDLLLLAVIFMFLFWFAYLTVIHYTCKNNPFS